MSYERRLKDLLSKFQYIDRDSFGAPKRFAVVSQQNADEAEHWIDGFSDSWKGAAKIVAGIDPEWHFVGVYDLSGEAGSEVETVGCSVTYSVSDGTSSPGEHRVSIDCDDSDPVGTHDRGEEDDE